MSEKGNSGTPNPSVPVASIRHVPASSNFTVQGWRRCPTCGESEDPFAPDCCECHECERCRRRAPLLLKDGAIVRPPGWSLDFVVLCWHCVEHVDAGTFLEQVDKRS